MKRTCYYISRRGRDTFTDRQMEREASDLGLRLVPLDPLEVCVSIDASRPARLVVMGRELEILPDAVVYRKSVLPHAWIIQKFLMDRGVTGLKGKVRGAGKAGLDKLADYELLAGSRVRVPRTVAVAGLDQLENALCELGETFPLILKKVAGTHGIGVFLIADRRSLRPLAEFLFEHDARPVLLLQSFVSSSEGKDIRAVVLSGEVVAAVLRDNSGRDFRANVYQGAIPSAISLTEDQKKAAVDACAALQCDFGGVDLLLGEEGPVVAEVNSPCDYSFVERTTGIPITRRILTFLLEKRAGR